MNVTRTWLQVRTAVGSFTPMRRGCGGRRRAGTAIAALLCGGWPAIAALQVGDTIRYGDDKLTVRIHGASLDDVLAEVATVTGAQLRGRPKDVKPVVAEFDAVPVSEALHRLLGDQNFTLTYGKNGKLGSIRLHGGPAAPAPASPHPPGTPAPPPGAPSATSVIGQLDEHDPLPISGRLSEILGSNTATFRQLFEVAARNDEGPMRTESMRVILNALEAEPDLRNQLVTTIKAVDDATLAQFMRGATGERAEEMLMHISALARGSELRVKASTVLQQLRSQGPGG